ncbi:hypothetical protein [Pseudarthrobacter sp. BIM B-2242]|uniref:hypothetical protein n=1 Tax=Pseudarthrobacter sp. BIM B-2242 TaxID=2772401 RepID=UPI00168A4626|nr:hypothetical protein [Pseudarthrobacter sp. BIM B-2242]QOD06101.1 hypothetical protein IDT60_21310 [Pseudarthrobacter sp. BIM B-2242]
MTFTPARQPEGIPTGGQFAAAAHSDAVASLQPTHTIYTAPLTGTIELKTASFDTLPEWPADLPEPEVSFDFSGGKCETYVTVDNQVMTFWESDSDGIINNTYNGENPWEEFDEEDQEKALEWGKQVHRRIDSSTYGIMIEACTKTDMRDIILAQGLGKDPAPEPAAPDLTSTPVRDAYLLEAEARLAQAVQEIQGVYMIGAAQELRKDFPAIDSFELTAGGKGLEIAAAWDADGNEIDRSTVQAADREVFRYRNEDDFNTFLDGRTITVEEAISFRPGA